MYFIVMFYVANLRTNIVSPSYGEPIDTIADAVRLANGRTYTNLEATIREVYLLFDGSYLYFDSLGYDAVLSHTRYLSLADPIQEHAPC